MSLGEKPSSGPAFSAVVEECDDCDRETTHEISIKMRTENPDSENAEFSREPYRVAECTVCGDTSTERMNNA